MARLLAFCVLLVAALAFVVLRSLSTAESETSLHMLVAWSTGSGDAADVTLEQINRLLAEADDVEIALRRSGPDVVPPFEQLEPVSSGIFDLHYTNPAYHAGATEIGQLLSTVRDDPQARRDTGIWDWVDTYYRERHNLKVLAIIPSVGYQFLLREPLADDRGLEGRAIRSNPAYDRMIENLGGSPVQTAFPQVYSSLQRNLVDGSAWPMHSMSANRIHEVIGYMARPTFGAANHLWLMNLDAWNRLADNGQARLLAVGEELERTAQAAHREVFERDEAQMLAAGAQFTWFGDSLAARLDRLFVDSTRARARPDRDPYAREFIALIDRTGMSSAPPD